MTYKFLLLFTGLFFLANGCTSSSQEPDFTIIKSDGLPKNRLINYWNTQRKGTNYFNEVPTKAWFDAAAAANIRTIRFVYAKWVGQDRDFLIGNADNYTGLVPEDVAQLTTYLDYADSLDLKVLLTPLSLPGARYFQNNEFTRDYRLWKEEKFQLQAAQFWQDVATAFKGHPALVGYTLVNEPHPEKSFGIHDFWGQDFTAWYDTIRNTPADLNLFNKRMVSAIRQADPEMPIVIESGLFATPATFSYLDTLADDKLLYSFHFYDPYSYTTRRINKGEIAYPGPVYVQAIDRTLMMNDELLDSLLQPVRDWSVRNQIPANRVFASEFGGDRMSAGIPHYFTDLIKAFNTAGWHWAFYSFREDVWESMDYELGTQKPYYKYWDYQDTGTLHEHYHEVYGRVKDRELWSVFEREFSGGDAGARER
jgi:hypothetical protein